MENIWIITTDGHHEISNVPNEILEDSHVDDIKFIKMNDEADAAYAAVSYHISVNGKTRERLSFFILDQQDHRYKAPLDIKDYDSIRVYTDPSNTGDDVYAVVSKDNLFQTLHIEARPEGGLSVIHDKGTTVSECKALIPARFSTVAYKWCTAIRSLSCEQVLVFGSDDIGSHKGGAAAFAVKYFGAVPGVSEGLAGQSYAIPSMSGQLNVMRKHVRTFIDFAKDHQEYEFLLTRVGCGTAGWADYQIAPLFKRALDLPNILIPFSWEQYRDLDDMEIPDSPLYGRGNSDEWIARLLVMYCRHIKANLRIDGTGKATVDSDHDRIAQQLISLFNNSDLSSDDIRWNTHMIKQYSGYPDIFFENMVYPEFKRRLSQGCLDMAEGTTLNPYNYVSAIVSDLLSRNNAKKVFYAYSGIGTIASDNVEESILHEPSSLKSLIARIYNEERISNARYVSGRIDFKSMGCDAFVAFPPFNLMESRKTNSGTMFSHFGPILLNNLLSAGDDISSAIVLVPESVLKSKKYEQIRLAMIKEGILSEVIILGQESFLEAGSGSALLYLDYRNESDVITFTDLSKNTWKLRLRIDEEDEMITRIHEGCVHVDIDRSLLLNTGAILDYNIYQTEFPDVAGMTYVPLGDLVREIVPEPFDETDKVKMIHFRHLSREAQEILKPHDLKDFDFDNKYHKRMCYSGPSLQLSRRGVFLNKDDVKTFTFSPSTIAFKADTAKVDYEYLVLQLFSQTTDGKSCYNFVEFPEEYRVNFLLNWKIAIPDGGLEAQRKIVAEAKDSPVLKNYNIITIGSWIKDCPWSENGITVLGNFSSMMDVDFEEELRNSSISRRSDAIVIASDTDYDEGCEGISELLYSTQALKYNKPIYIINKDIPEKHITRAIPPKLRDEFKNQIIRFDDSQSYLKLFREDLEYKTSHDFETRAEYKEYLDNAKIIDAKWPELKGVEDFVLEFLSECKKDASKFPEKSFTNLRTIRDQILYQLSRVGAIPPLNDEGAMAALLADRIYTDDKTVYYQLKGHMPHVLAEGVRFIGNISNEAIHESEGNKELAMSLTHILLSLINWTAQHIKEGFFERSHSGSWIKAVDFKNEHEVKSGDEYKVNNTLRNGKPYWYCKNIHIGGDDVKRLQPGKTLKIGKASNEKQPFITDEVQCIFYCEDWTLVD